MMDKLFWSRHQNVQNSIQMERVINKSPTTHCVSWQDIIALITICDYPTMWYALFVFYWLMLVLQMTC